MLDLLRRAFPLCDPSQHSAAVPADFVTAIARSAGGRRQARRSNLQTPAGMAAGFRKLRIAACFLAPLSASTLPLSVTAADAAETSASLSSSVVSYAAFVTEASRRFAIPEQWIRAVIQVESASNAQAVSPRGALGLMQIMPQTWVELSVRYDLGLDPFDLHDNILAGTAYLREMLDRFGSEGFLAAYNAGPQRYEEYLATGRPLPGQTQAYVAKLTSLTEIEHRELSRSIVKHAIRWQNGPVFVEQLRSASADDQRASAARLTASSSASSVAHPSALVPRATGLFVWRSSEVQSR